MQRELTAYEVYIRNWKKRQRQAEDQEMLDDSLKELKMKHDKERKEKIADLKEQLRKIEGKDPAWNFLSG